MKSLILLFFALSSFALAGVAPYSLPNDTLSLGKAANTSANKTILFNKNATNNPGLRWNGSTSKFQVSEDGTTWNDVVNGASVDGTTTTYSGGKVVVVNSGVNLPGIMFAWTMPTCPTNSHEADGSSQLRSAFPLLSALYCPAGTCTTYGSVDGTHFNFPPFRNRYLRGSGTATDGNGGTAVATGSYQEAETRIYTAMTSGTESAGHTHSYSLWVGNGQNGGSDAGYGGGPFGLGNLTGGTTGGESATHTHTLTTGTGGAETRVKSYGVTFCIWYQ
jgi:hypothetical protein